MAQEEKETTIEEKFRDALYLEEVKGDSSKALKVYEALTGQFDRDRNLAATALYRQGECLRKLNRHEEAAVCYQKVLSLYSDQEQVARLSRENLKSLGIEIAGNTEPKGGVSKGSDEQDREIARLAKIIRDSPDLLNASSGEQLPPLLQASEKGQERVVRFLLENGADVNVASGGQTALLQAAEAGHLAVCQILLDAGAQVNPPHRSPLIASLEAKRIEVAKLLIASKANPNRGTSNLRVNSSWSVYATPLGLACHMGEAKIVSALIKAGADVNLAMNKSGNTRVIPNRRNQPASKQGNQSTPLEFALLAKNQEIIDLILESGGDPDAKTGRYHSPPIFLTIRGGDEGLQLTKKLLEAGASPLATDSMRKTLLHIAAEAGSLEGIKLALSSGVKINATTVNKETALHLGNVANADTLKLLLENGALVNATDSDMGTVLNRVVNFGSRYTSERERCLEMMKVLLEHGADANNASHSSGPPLAVTVNEWNDARCWTEGSRLLLQHGATLTKHWVQVDPSLRPLQGAVLELWDDVWEASNHKRNEHRENAIWVSRDRDLVSSFNGSNKLQPDFYAAVSRDGGAERSTLRQLVRLSEPVQGKGLHRVVIRRPQPAGGDDEVHEIDFIDHLQKDKEFELRAGDIVEFFRAGGEELDEKANEVYVSWLDQEEVIEIRLEPGPNQVLVNTGIPEGSSSRFMWKGNAIPSKQVSFAGTHSIFKGVTREVRRCDLDTGEMEIVDQGELRHGDILRLVPGTEPLEAPSERRLSRGVFVCEKEEGPFWEIEARELRSVAQLVYAISVPNGTPFGAIDWEKSKIRVNWEYAKQLDPFGGVVLGPPTRSQTWYQSPLIDSIEQSLQLDYSTILVLPRTDTPQKLPEQMLQTIKKQASFDWTLYVDDSFRSAERFEPFFPELHSTDKGWVWRTDASAITRSQFPVMGRLVWSLDPDLGVEGNGNAWLEWYENEDKLRIYAKKMKSRVPSTKRRVIVPPSTRR